ncbi:MAG: LCP family protein [Oscillospiraceae bacterium]|nr:LCP family protein [Oscillospiraceae bacterium]
MKFSDRKGTALFSVFLLTMLIVTEALTLLLLWQWGVPLAAVWLLFGVLSLVSLVLWRGMFPKSPRFAMGKRFVSCLLSIVLTVGCAAGSFMALELSSSLDNMFGEAEVPLTAAPPNPHKEPFIVYLGGSDTRSGKLTKGRNDVNILAVINPNTRQLLLVNTPRDYYVSNPAGDGAKDKLAHCGLYSLENSKEALSQLYGVPVAYGGVINFKGFEALIDALGGVTVYSETAFTTTIGGYRIQAGANTLNGAQALAFARERSKLAGGDNTRGQHQMQVIGAMVRQLSAGNVLSRWREILNSLEGMFVTDMPLTTMTKLLTSELDDLDEWEIFSAAVTGKGGTDYNWSSGGKAYVMYPDDSVGQVAALMQQVLDGERLTENVP